MNYGTLATGIVFTFVGIIAGYFITGWYHRLNRRIRLQEAQLFLLSEIARQQGVHNEVILKAFNHSKGYGTLDAVLDNE